MEKEKCEEEKKWRKKDIKKERKKERKKDTKREKIKTNSQTDWIKTDERWNRQERKNWEKIKFK